MEACDHTSWVEFSTSHMPSLIDTGRLDRLVKVLDAPTRQRPQIVACVGHAGKRRAMSQWFPGYVAPSEPPRVHTALHLDATRDHIEYPLFFVDCSPEAPIPVREESWMCHGTMSRDAARALPCSPNKSTVFAGKLLPFVDVLCIFADDFDNLEHVLALLEEWTARNSASTMRPWKARPRASIVTFAPLTSNALREQRAFTSRLRAIKRRRHFSSIRLVRFWPRSTVAARDRALKDLILCEDLTIVRDRRLSDRTLFSAQHLSWFFTQAVHHRNGPHQFNFVTASRLSRPVPVHFYDLLREFFRLARDHMLPYETIAKVIASAIILDAYPSSAHGKADTLERPELAT